MAKLRVTTNNSGEQPTKQEQDLIGTEGKSINEVKSELTLLDPSTGNLIGTEGKNFDNITVELTQLDPVTGKPTGNSQTIKITSN